MITVLLAEDQQMMREALVKLLRLEPDIDVVADVGTGDAAIECAQQLQPDVALLDIEMPGTTGLEAAGTIRQLAPACQVLILTTFSRPGYLRRAMEAGARGFLVKDAPVDELASAIRRTVAGEKVIDPALAATALSSGRNPLTERERAVLAESVDGAAVSDVAAKLYLSESTVRNYLSSAISKTGTRNRIEAAHTARTNGWL